MSIIPVILSGGSGTRLWPLSRAAFPKQLISLVSDKTMIQETVGRLSGLEVREPIIVCNEQHRFIIAEQMNQIGVKNPVILLEPVAKNTAPAIVAAALKAMQIDENSVIVVLPSDHNIKDSKVFCEAVSLAAKEAQKGSLVTFGITPTFPATGYGYIESEKKDGECASIKRFVEKPNLETAKKYLESGNFLWNSGMFIFRADSFIEEIKNLDNSIFEATSKSLLNAKVDLDFIRLEKESFEKNPSISIDYAVMEKTKKGKVIPLNAGWSDVGSWNSLWDVSEKDSFGNVVKGNAVLDGVENSFVYGKNRVVTAIGLKDVVIVDTKDALLVADKSKSESVKNIVDRLKDSKNPAATENTIGYRPWGFYETIEKGERFKVKHITVKPGQKLSVQLHYHRAEHWIIVSGTAKVLNGEKELILTENQSTFIPLGTVHAIENPGKLPLEFIEVQSGSYLEEDDIVRFEDKYGRA
ncbi:mannose-1-phosphate guanylyltransferase/mannose-6-phosphate isomerase [Treponema zioleckii]|uniref:mannose-1-phosphate guanylyltransferase/mannose-6-phosphate isomerase n=1 Tax=Treponema zioleckii TaxID=331680 RepID=UPI00168B4C3D|nr:mannose-1-phosphate guanylyltransferase/mannose-6-phosphate isomerase [Treponema zioleckii]